MKKIFLLAIITAACNFSFVSAKTWRVSNIDATANFSTLDAAMQGITAGDTLYLEGSNFVYTLSNPITKKVAIIGSGYWLADNPNTSVSKLEAYIAADGASIMANGTLIEGVVLYNKGQLIGNFYIAADDVIIRKCRIETKISFDDNNTNTQLQIKNTTIMQCYIYYALLSTSNKDTAYNSLIVNNIFGNNNPSLQYLVNAVIENNTFTGTGSSISNNTGCYIRNNLLAASGIIGTTNTNCTISNNYVTGATDYTTSVKSSDGKWQLAPASGGMTASTDGGQCGAFGGASPYVLSGLATLPYIYEIDAPTVASAAGGLRVTVKVWSGQ